MIQIIYRNLGLTATDEGRFQARGDLKNPIKNFKIKLNEAGKIFATIFFFIFPNLLDFLGKIN